MNLFKCLCLGIVAILLCGCGESRAEFNALNAGKMSVVYENQTLKIAESTNFVILSVSEESQKKNNRDSSPTAQNDNLKKIAESRLDSAILQKEPPTNSSIVDESQRVASEAKQKSGLRSHEQGNRTNGSLTKRVASLPDLSPQDEFDFILFFFTSTCGVCKAQIPILEQLSAQGIKIYAILGDMPDISKASAFASAHKISLPLFYESSAKRFFTSAVGGVKGVPVIAIFSNGKMKEKFIGLTPKSTLLRAI